MPVQPVKKRGDREVVAKLREDDGDEELAVVRRPAKKDQRPVRRFRLKAGYHTQRSTDPNQPYMFAPGAIIESRADLVKLHGSEKFEEVGGTPQEVSYKYPLPEEREPVETPDGEQIEDRSLDNLTDGGRTVNETNRMRRQAAEALEDAEGESEEAVDAEEETDDEGEEKPARRKSRRKG